MSKVEMLYVKGMNVSDPESADEESEEDIWDDTKLNQAYDKAVSIANAEIAKRVAMATNKRNSTEGNSKASKTSAEAEPPQPKDNKNKHKARKSKQKKPNLEWKVGMPCRAVYNADGLEYEAFLLSIVNHEDCVVRFLGYENSEVVSISSLKPSGGNKERALQIEEALCNHSGNTEEEGDLVGERNMDCDSGAGSSSAERSQRRRKKSGKKNRKPAFEMPFPMPEMPNFNNLHFPSLDLPMTMPPPLPLSSSLASGNAEEQAMCSMLLSWYCSGYYTGLYQGMQRAKQQKQQSGNRTTRH